MTILRVENKMFPFYVYRSENEILIKGLTGEDVWEVIRKDEQGPTEEDYNNIVSGSIGFFDIITETSPYKVKRYADPIQTNR